MLQALNLRTGEPLLGPGAPLPGGRPGVAGTSVLVPGGPFALGVDAATEPHSLDNERPAHVVDVPAFLIGRVPVTNAEWQAFIGDGGYHEPALVVRTGLGVSQNARVSRRRCSGTLTAPATGFGRGEAVPPDEPVQHVTYFEAQAYAKWAGARLPTEIEWEKACAWDPARAAAAPLPLG